MDPRVRARRLPVPGSPFDPISRTERPCSQVLAPVPLLARYGVYAKGDRAAAAESGDGNVRNGTSKKTVQTGIGPVELEIPRDRDSSFAPAIVPKHARRVGGFDEAIVSLYAKGLMTGDPRPPVRDLRRRGL